MNDVRERSGDVSLGDLLLELLRFYRDFGLLLVPVALVAALVAGGLALRYPLYGATALLETPQMSLDQWRRLLPMLSDRQLVAATLADASLPDGAAPRLQRPFQQPRYWSTRVGYRSTVGRDDIREQINIDPKKIGALGLEVSLNVRDEAAAAQQFAVIASHIRQVMLWGDLREYLDRLRQEVLEQRSQLQIEQIRRQFAIEQGQKQVEDMHRLLQQYPELRRSEVNTVVSVGDGGGRYLSPLAQIVALESTMSDTRSQLRKGVRELEQLQWKQRFLDRVDARLDGLASGKELARWMEQCLAGLFPADTAENTAQRQAGSEIRMNLEQSLSRAGQLRYKALPALPVAPLPSRRHSFVAAAVFAGTLLALSMALGSYVALRRAGGAPGTWSARQDPLFAWLPERLRRRLPAGGAEGGRA
ncbi:hypothetical protein [Paracidovorax cattleyae]|uniref:Chain length determinant protein n=3 Tax=Paracidovorax cattleyae TaxID=80868 RepID=A0A1H0W7Y7_9BURK|nr:hypothetical protein [Paracidovorax cattleyae]AVS73410.1 hypothetical protein C8240_04520 [Paracidovorax cattleyae]SDP86525.1 hypothetical protein SAMN04489708_13349 [Paracidovorax cattleyae]